MITYVCIGWFALTIQAVRCLLDDDGGSSTLTPEVCRQLLLEVPENSEATNVACKTTPCERSDQKVNDPLDETSGLHLVKGYPAVPLYVRLSNCLAHWILHKSVTTYLLSITAQKCLERVLHKRRFTWKCPNST